MEQHNMYQYKTKGTCSAGARGHQMLQPPLPLAELLHAQLADLTS